MLLSRTPLLPPHPNIQPPLYLILRWFYLSTMPRDTLLLRGEGGRERERHLAAYIHSVVIITFLVFVRAIVQPSRKERSSFARETEQEDSSSSSSFASFASSPSHRSPLLVSLPLLYSSLALWLTEILRGSEWSEWALLCVKTCLPSECRRLKIPCLPSFGA